MNLDVYLKRVNKKKFAQKLSISPRALANYASGKRLAPLDVAHDIEKITDRYVKTEDLLNKWREKNYEKLA
jgi:DNA-binding transcriptional regulator YdaS (Cro superfamily)